MKAFSGYAETKAYGSGMEQLPKGGYVCKIMKASVESSQYGEQLVIALDIVEGDYKDYYANEYRNQDREDKKWHGNYYLSIPTDDGSEKDGWTKRKFKTFTNAVEDSNAGYTWNWDENTLKGKLFGGPARSARASSSFRRTDRSRTRPPVPAALPIPVPTSFPFPKAPERRVCRSNGRIPAKGSSRIFPRAGRPQRATDGQGQTPL